MNQKNDINLRATFKLAGNYVHYHYFDNDSEIRESKFVEYGQPATNPDFVVNETSILSENGWIFKKWKNTNGGVKFGKPITEETHYYGQWELKKDLSGFKLSGSTNASDKGTYNDMYFPKNGKMNCNMRCDGSHSAAVGGHEIQIYVQVYDTENNIGYYIVNGKHMISPKTKNEPIGLVLLPESILLKQDYNQLIVTIKKYEPIDCYVNWTFDGDIVMVLD
jgi:hypothetical protein